MAITESKIGTTNNYRNLSPATNRIVLAHGGGGQLTDELLTDIIRPILAENEIPAGQYDDAAVISMQDIETLAFTTDSYVVNPLEFPGGNIGLLAISGTVNDLAVSGADPLGLSLGLIIEEGLDINLLKRILISISQTCIEAGVNILTGDTKVVACGQADGLYINTTGIGRIRPDRKRLNIKNIQPGDKVLINGTIADHGMAVMLQREGGAAIISDLKTDAAPLNHLITTLLDNIPGIVFMRDPTRGGLAGVAADMAEYSNLKLTLDETKIPIRSETLYAADMLGIDPLDVANEGKVVIVVRPEDAEQVFELMKKHPLGRQTSIIGEFAESHDGLCEIITEVGGRRIIQKPYGEQLPRIC